MLVAENQRRLRLCLRLIARLHFRLQPVDFPIQRLNIALQTAVLGIRSWIRRSLIGGIRVLVVLSRVIIGERIVVPAVKTVGIISGVRVVKG